jgi:hypothetical protein
MKAFLSHSSRDKALVEKVAELVGGGNVELDSITFDHGLLNVEAVDRALKRSALFVLFLTTDAVESHFVRFEAFLAQELIARGLIDKFLVVCLDEKAFKSAEASWKHFNFVRKVNSAQSIARLIQHNLILARSKGVEKSSPFVGRAKELHDAKETLSNPLTPNIRALYISGNAGIGRRTFSRHLFQDIYPSVNSVSRDRN